MIKDPPGMPRLLPFKSDVRFKIPLTDLIHLFGVYPPDEGSKTSHLGAAVIRRMREGGKLAIPGHVMNAYECRLLHGGRDIAIPSRVSHWLYENRLIEADGSLTIEGKTKIFSSGL